MDPFQVCSRYLYDNPCHQLDFYDRWDCLDTCPSTLYIQPTIIRCILESEPLIHSADNRTNNDQCLKPTTPSNEPTIDATNSEKFCIHVNVAGFDREMIKIKVENGKIVVEANQDVRQKDGDFNIRQFRKTYELPKQADIARITSNVISDSMLVIEVPIRNSENEDHLAQAENNKNQSLTQSDQSRHSLSAYINFLMSADFHPRIVDKDNNEKLLEMTIDVKKCQPEEIKISVKDNELIIQGEHKFKENHHSRRSRFFKSTTLPVGAQVNQMSTKLCDDGQLKIEVPILLE